MKNAIMETMRNFSMTDLYYLLPVLAGAGIIIGFLLNRSKHAEQNAFCAFDNGHSDSNSDYRETFTTGTTTVTAEPNTTEIDRQPVRELEPSEPEELPAAPVPAEEPSPEKAPETAEVSASEETTVTETETATDIVETISEVSNVTETVDIVTEEEDNVSEVDNVTETETSEEIPADVTAEVIVKDTVTEPVEAVVTEETVTPENKTLFSVMEIVTATGVTESRVRKSIKAFGIEAVQQVRNEKGRLVKVYDFETVRKALEDAGQLGQAAENNDKTEESVKAEITEDSILSIMEIVKETGVSESCVRKDIKAAELSPSAETKSGKHVIKGYRFGDVKKILLERNRMTVAA